MGTVAAIACRTQDGSIILKSKRLEGSWAARSIYIFWPSVQRPNLYLACQPVDFPVSVARSHRWHWHAATVIRVQKRLGLA
jgi:hypothetical protein